MLDKNNLYGNVPYCARMDGTTSDGKTLHQRKTPDWSNIMTFSVGDNYKYFANISLDKYCKRERLFIDQTFWLFILDHNKYFAIILDGKNCTKERPQIGQTFWVSMYRDSESLTNIL